MVQAAGYIAQSVLTKKWQFFVPPKGMTLITSDNPVHFDIPKELVPFTTGGPCHPQSELVMHLRRDLAVVCTWKPDHEHCMVFEMDKQEAKKFNRGVAKKARRFLFADHRSDGLDRLAKKYEGVEQKFVFGDDE